MAMDNDDVISVLNDLIETCEDGLKGFRAAAEAVHNPQAKVLFNSRLDLIQRGEADLSAVVRRLGGDPENRGTASGALHRGWMNVKSTVTGNDDEAIVAEAERGENAAVERYEDALKKDLPPEIRKLVDTQYRGVVQNRDRVRQLRQTMRETPAASTRRPDREAPPPM